MKCAAPKKKKKVHNYYRKVGKVVLRLLLQFSHERPLCVKSGKSHFFKGRRGAKCHTVAGSGALKAEFGLNLFSRGLPFLCWFIFLSNRKIIKCLPKSGWKRSVNVTQNFTMMASLWRKVILLWWLPNLRLLLYLRNLTKIVQSNGGIHSILNILTYEKFIEWFLRLITLCKQ